MPAEDQADFGDYIPPSKINTTKTIVSLHNHPLTRKSPSYASGSWLCDVCHTEWKTSNPSWNCEKCEFDACDACVDKNEAPQDGSTPKGIPHVHHHPLSKGKDNYTKCSHCNAWQPGQPNWSCSKCSLNFCEGCQQLCVLQLGDRLFGTKAELRRAQLDALTNASILSVVDLLDLILQYIDPHPPRWALYTQVDVLVSPGNWVEGRITKVYISAKDDWISMVEADQESDYRRGNSKKLVLPQLSSSIRQFRTFTVSKRRFDADMMMCRMLFPSSGRIGFEKLTVNSDTQPHLYQAWTELAIKYHEEHTKQYSEKSQKDDETKNDKGKLDMKVQDYNEEELEDMRKEFLMKMIKREASLRLSSYGQQEMDRYRHNEGQVTVVTEGLQLRAVHEFGFIGKQKEQLGLTLLQSASNMYPDHPQIKDTFYVKFNRCEPGNLHVGQDCPDVSLSTPQGQKTTLLTHYRQLAQAQCGYEEKSGLPAPLLVVVAGSST